MNKTLSITCRWRWWGNQQFSEGKW